MLEQARRAQQPAQVPPKCVGRMTQQQRRAGEPKQRDLKAGREASQAKQQKLRIE
jgi:hypothetical protein